MTPNRSLNQIMAEDDFSKVISKNKNVLIAIAIGIVIGVVGFGLFSTFSDKSKTQHNAKIYKYEAEALKSYVDKPDAKVLIEAFKVLSRDVGNYVGIIPIVIKTSDALINQNHLNEALDVLLIGKNASKNDYANYFILSRLSVVYEDLGQDQNAIDVLEKMNSLSIKIFEGKNYLDLGRLYLKKGDKLNAKTSFNYVIEKAKDESEFVKIAKLYLAKM